MFSFGEFEMSMDMILLLGMSCSVVFIMSMLSFASSKDSNSESYYSDLVAFDEDGNLSVKSGSSGKKKKKNSRKAELKSSTSSLSITLAVENGNSSKQDNVETGAGADTDSGNGDVSTSSLASKSNSNEDLRKANDDDGGTAQAVLLASAPSSASLNGNNGKKKRKKKKGTGGGNSSKELASSSSSSSNSNLSAHLAEGKDLDGKVSNQESIVEANQTVADDLTQKDESGDWDVAGRKGESTLERLRRDVKGLEDQLAMTKNLASNNQSAYESEAAKNRALVSMLKQREQIAENVVQKLESDLQESQQNVELLKSSNINLQGAIDRITADFQNKLESFDHIVQSEKQSLIDKLNANEQQLYDAQEMLHSQTTQIVSLESDKLTIKGQSDAIILTLQNQNSQIKAELETSQLGTDKMRMDIALANDTICQLESDLEKAKNESSCTLTELNVVLGEKKLLLEKVHELEETIGSLEKAKNESSCTLTELNVVLGEKKVLLEKVHELEETIGSLEKAKNESSCTLTELNVVLGEKKVLLEKVHELEETIGSLEKASALAQAEKENLRVSLEEAQSASFAQSSESLLAQKESEKEELLKEIASLKETEGKLRLVSNNFLSKIKDMDDEKQALIGGWKVEGEQFASSIASAEAREKMLTEELESLKVENAKALTDIEKERGIIESTKKSHESEVALLRSQLESLESNKSTLASSLQREQEDSQLRIKEVERQLELSMENLERFKEELVVVGKAFKETEEERDRLRDSVSKLKLYNMTELTKFVVNGENSVAGAASDQSAAESKMRYMELKSVLERATRESFDLKLQMAHHQSSSSNSSSRSSMEERLQQLEVERKSSLLKLEEMEQSSSNHHFLTPTVELEMLKRDVKMYSELLAKFLEAKAAS